MLAVSRLSPLRSSTPSKRDGDETAEDLCADFDFDFDFTELFAGIGEADVDVLPDLEMDTSEVLADFSAAAEETAALETEMMAADSHRDDVPVEREGKVSSEEEESSTAASASEANSSPPVVEKTRKPSAAHSKSSQSQGKRKVKVDWTPELHRRFVLAVEQLGVEKAVPSRILELMGIDCLTRHNVASHLQKYRSHLKHMMARKAETVSWSQRRQMYGAAVPAGAGSAAGVKGENIRPWLQTPTMGLPPPAHHHPHIPTLRPFHVWGHPAVDQSLLLFPARPAAVLSPPWLPPYSAPPPHGTPWPPHFPKVALTKGTPYFPQPLPTMRFPGAPVTGIPPHPVYHHDGVFPSASPPPGWLIQLDAHPSSESIDAAIGEVLVQPWLPLPLALKPPSLESVLLELQKQGISNIPPCN